MHFVRILHTMAWQGVSRRAWRLKTRMVWQERWAQACSSSLHCQCPSCLHALLARIHVCVSDALLFALRMSLCARLCQLATTSH
jgi:hypothetical protein